MPFLSTKIARRQKWQKNIQSTVKRTTTTTTTIRTDALTGCIIEFFTIAHTHTHAIMNERERESIALKLAFMHVCVLVSETCTDMFRSFLNMYGHVTNTCQCIIDPTGSFASDDRLLVSNADFIVIAIK